MCVSARKLIYKIHFFSLSFGRLFAEVYCDCKMSISLTKQGSFMNRSSFCFNLHSFIDVVVVAAVVAAVVAIQFHV